MIKTLNFVFWRLLSNSIFFYHAEFLSVNSIFDQEYAVDRRSSRDMSSDASARSPWTGLSQFLPTTQKILQFSNKEGPKATDKIVYVAGAFDLFHVGHLDFLEKAKALGTYLIVGLHTDPVVNRSASAYCMIIDCQKQCFGSGAGSVCFCASKKDPEPSINEQQRFDKL